MGIRSIGTTLSALVAVTLVAAGFEVTRCTVRPAGHPFERRIDFIPADVKQGTRVIVVDEGPGISGSSMAGAAKALAAAGIAPENIAFFPGNNHEPGPAASSEVRRWWSNTPRFFTPLEAMSWSHGGVKESLCMKAAEICDADEAFSAQELGGGAWRHVAHEKPCEWPAVARAFERQKLLCKYGQLHAVHWKFVGLGAFVEAFRTAEEVARERSEKLARWTPGILTVYHGFMATLWITGKRCCAENEPQAFPTIIEYLIDAAGSAMEDDDQGHAIDRLSAMLVHNTKATLDEHAVASAVALSDAVCGSQATASYGDGRLAPHEWIRCVSGRLWKTDCFGHQTDHTIVGKQSVLWDVAGAFVEWQIREPSCAGLMAKLGRCGIKWDAQALRYYRAAYAAFRMGQTKLCATMESDADEQRRLLSAAAVYRADLACSLSVG